MGSPWVQPSSRLPQSRRTVKRLLWQTDLDFAMGMCFLTRWVHVWVRGLPLPPPLCALLFSPPAAMLQIHSVVFFNETNKKCSRWVGSLRPISLTLHLLSTPSLTWAKLALPTTVLSSSCFADENTTLPGTPPHRCDREAFGLSPVILRTLLWVATQFLVYPTWGSMTLYDTGLFIHSIAHPVDCCTYILFLP